MPTSRLAMMPWRNSLPSAALLLCAGWMTVCTPHSASQDKENQAGAAPIPTHILTLDKSGSVTEAQQGDFIEIALAEPAPADGRWRLSRQSGDGRLEATGPEAAVHDTTGPKRVFRYRALGIGRVELAFAFHAPPQAQKPERVVTFRIVIR